MSNEKTSGISNQNSNQAGKTGGFQVVEAYKTIRANLLYTLGAAKNKAVIITSAEPDAGKSVTAANLSISLAQTASRVLLIDGDMRKPSQHKLFRLQNQDGLSKILSGQSSIDMAIHRQVAFGLDIITAGTIPPNPSELLGSAKMNSLIDELVDKYDYIFIDAPPVNVVSDVLTVMDLVAGAIIIVRQKYSLYSEVQRAVESILNIGGNVLGAIITDVKESYSPYGGLGKYGYYRYKSYSYEYKKQGK